MDTSAPLLGEPLPVELMNTIWADRDGVHDALTDAVGTRAWLQAVAPRTELLTPDEVAALPPSALEQLGGRLTDLRDALRRLAAEATEDARTTAGTGPGELQEAVARLNRAAGDTPHWSVLSWTPGQEPSRHLRAEGEGAAAAVSALADEAVALFGQDTRHQLRACPGPGCVLYFMKNHPRREWCSAGCGNRARSARHYQRHRRTTV
ncbi:CGNR zinc finger domain-containing protein [Streptomyces sp. NPDC057094]|uniref:CGNR zinc finger domain-containing protein n=1 Tax=Streptomyces sp. NPDC057094 TaxID=3346018 RepID=UPI0036306B98